ncbi:TonB-dependent receptor [Labilibacter marinus]|uniref:hypothetical protein n=1 Tax=Labilibacter marinus TaxID=1477105 RepID=UPI00117AC738|nr:hypothetical protein [Labilibacter marinus]
MIGLFHIGEAQQLDQIGKKDPIKINGGVNMNQVYRSNVTGDVNPYSLVLNGNVNTSIYGMSVPLSFTWSNYQWTYTQPFNQFTLSPSYKWATAHIGWSSMSFSPYSLNGHSFSGLGVELDPNEKIKLSAMYGRLLKASPGDTINGYKPQYKRMGGGLKTTYQFQFGEIGVHFFRAWDDDERPVDYIDSLGVSPKENLVVGTSFSVRPVKSIAFSGEYSVSALSEDNRISAASDIDGAATFLHHAIKSDLTWSTRLGSLGAGIEYVEPGFNTLGSYYMVNDFINYTVNATTSLVSGKVNVAASVGIRETNTDDQSETDQKDVINNINISFVPNDKLSFNLNYSNFYNYSFVRPLFDETNTHTEYELMDTLRFTQINENFALNANWGVKVTDEQNHSIMASVNVQQATQSQSDAVENSNTNFFNGSGGYSWSLIKSDFNLALNMNYSRNKLPDAISEAYGPILSVRKGMLEKTLRHRLSLSWNGTYVDQIKNGDVLTARLGSSYTIKKKHRLNLSVAWSKRSRNTGTITSYTTATLGYSYQFGWPKKDTD